jgi:hypothetical protein
MATTPGTDIVPVFQDLIVQTSSGEGRAIALRWTGDTTMYLVVSTTDATGRPRWLDESEINLAHIGQPPD